MKPPRAAMAGAACGLLLACGAEDAIIDLTGTTAPVGGADGAAGGAGGAGNADAGSDASVGNTISGSVVGEPFTSAANALWIGKVDATGSRPVIVFLFREPVSCAQVTQAGWDTVLLDASAAQQILELAVDSTAPGTYAVGKTASWDYRSPGHNPKGSGGTITVLSALPAQSISGSFAVANGGDALVGTFDATWCEAGVEP
jgi:hypothetical protein